MAGTTLTAADAVKLFEKQKITVSVVKTDKSGQPVRDAETNRIVTDEVSLAATHVIGIREEEDQVTITTLDGRKYSAKK